MTMAWAALILWPVVCVALFRMLTLPVAFCTSIIGGYLLLPSGVSNDLPLLPPLSKTTIPSLTALVLTMIALSDHRHTAFVPEGWMPRNVVPRSLVILFVLGAFGMVLTNSDPLYYGFRTLPGLTLYDGFSLLLNWIVMALPFFLARRVLATPEGLRVLVLTVVISALIYTLPALYEVRMSPQLHRMVYGFFPHSWLQAIRSGGFRPSVFLEHGLSLGIFLTLATIGAAGLFRAGLTPGRLKWLFAVAWLLAVLVLSKSLGALLIATAILPVALFCTGRIQLLFAACIAGVIVTYPALRAVDVVPTDRIAAFARSIDPGRAQSLQVRFYSEDLLLSKAMERPVFGWGLWSRNRVFNEQGRDMVITDGAWIGSFGVGGWAQYISVFGLFCWPVIALFRARQREVDPVSVTLALMLLANLVDLIPNAGMTPLTWMMAGALVGRLEGLHSADQPAPEPDRPAQRTQPGYARSFTDDDTKHAPLSKKTRDLKQSRHRRRHPAPGVRR